jgi:hypothetical protein
VRHTFAPVLQLNPPAQVPVVDVWQAPAPVHSRGWTKVAPALQLPATHWVPLAYRRQAPEPLQVPSLPHVDTAAIAHWLATAGAPPAGINEQVPILPVWLHDWQVPLQSRSQHTPCEHAPESHSSPIVQAALLGFLPHMFVVALHVLAAKQSADEVAVVHDVLHARLPSHRNGSQRVVLTVPQWTSPSHARGGVWVDVPAGHEPATHWVPAT